MDGGQPPRPSSGRGTRFGPWNTPDRLAVVEDPVERRIETSIGRVHALLMRLLLELHAASTQAGVPYYLAYGTAIGAVRHKDFIPWDADADVLVWRHDYPRLVEALRTRLPHDVTLHEPGDGSGYEYLFARLGIKGVDHPDIHVDLFPLELAPESRWQQRLYTAATRLLFQMHYMKNIPIGSRTHYTTAKRLVTRLSKIALVPVSAKSLQRAFEVVTRRFAARSSGRIVANSCGAYGHREFFDRSWFEDVATTPFRDSELCLASGTVEMLKSVYGDFMVPPPEAEQNRQLAFVEEHLLSRLRGRGLV